ncbi:MAG: hypothetical protein MN733_02940 [Nitrososphaera sp.]|nr:hypothetical protein [Nitrososphaera sp.]
METTIDNQTHWKSEDILRLARIASDAAGFDFAACTITVRFSNNANCYISVFTNTNISFLLPRRGESQAEMLSTLGPLHGLAIASIDSSTVLLSVKQSWLLANLLYNFMAKSMGMVIDAYLPFKHDTSSWCKEPQKLFISKSDDPTVDSRWLSAKAKYETVIKEAKSSIEHYQWQITRIEAKVVKAQKKLDAAQKKLEEAERRRKC